MRPTNAREGGVFHFMSCYARDGSGKDCIGVSTLLDVTSLLKLTSRYMVFIVTTLLGAAT